MPVPHPGAALGAYDKHELTDEEVDALKEIQVKCRRCKDTGWLEPIGPCSDGSYITSRPCSCEKGGM